MPRWRKTFSPAPTHYKITDRTKWQLKIEWARKRMTEVRQKVRNTIPCGDTLWYNARINLAPSCVCLCGNHFGRGGRHAPSPRRLQFTLCTNFSLGSVIIGFFFLNTSCCLNSVHSEWCGIDVLESWYIIMKKIKCVRWAHIDWPSLYKMGTHRTLMDWFQ